MKTISRSPSRPASRPTPRAAQAQLAPDSLAFALFHAGDVIAAVSEGRTLDTALQTCWQQQQPAPGQRGAIQDLAYGTLRLGERVEFLLGQLLRTPLEYAQIKGILLVAVYRILSRPEDNHTTVNQAVEATASLANGKFRSLANGVLRNFLRQQAALDVAANADLAAHWQHPLWWIEAVKAAYPAAWESVLTAANQHPPMTLRINHRHTDVSGYLARLAEIGIGARALDDTAILLDKPQSVDKLPGFRDGHASVQDWGAQQAARLLDVKPGMRVLDACAAPGGKTAHLLEMHEADVTALELDPKRAQRIHENLQRLGLKADVKVADCKQRDKWWDGKPFERILADVPCSASGVARRHPDIKWLRKAADIRHFAATQQGILDSLWHTLAAGGTMLYCTCSIFPQENAAQVAAFAARHDDVIRLPINGKPDLQLLPTAEQDGFYYALLAKRA